MKNIAIFFIFALVNLTTSGNASENNNIQEEENKYSSSNNWTKFIPKDTNVPKQVVFQEYQKDLDKSLGDKSSCHLKIYLNLFDTLEKLPV